MPLNKLVPILFAALLASLTQNAHAVLTIEITQGVDSALPIAVVPFDTSRLGGKFPVDLAAIVASDLNRSGVLKAMERGELPATPHYSKEVQYSRWRNVALQQRGAVFALAQRRPGLPGCWPRAGKFCRALHHRVPVARCAQAKAVGGAQHAGQEA